MQRDSGFDRFSARARRVLALSQEEAQRFNHGYIGTEHLLLGLVRDGHGVAARVLANLGVKLVKVRSAVEFIIGRGDRMVSRDIGFTPRSKRVIELAVDEARRLDHHYIGTEHLLLGLVREGEGIAAGVLKSRGVGLDRVRAEVLNVLAAGPDAAPPERDRPDPRAAESEAARAARLGPPLGALKRVIAVAQSRNWGAFALTILSIESFESAFTVQMRLDLDPAKRGTAATLENLPFTATDDLTTQYSGGRPGSRGSLDGTRTLNERWLSLLFIPSLDPDARELRLSIPEAWLADQPNAEPSDTTELRTFVIPLNA